MVAILARDLADGVVAPVETVSVPARFCGVVLTLGPFVLQSAKLGEKSFDPVRRTGIMNKSIRLLVTLVVLLFQGTCRSGATEPGAAEAALEKASMFALGGIGVAGTMSPGERALREIFATRDAVARMERLLTTATPAGQLYALLGLRLKDRALYNRVVQQLRPTDAKVETARGCMLSQDPFGDLVKEIERGQYDTFLDRKWPDGR